MSFTAPTRADFVGRFPRFNATKYDVAIDALLVEAIALIDDSWSEDDRTPAILYLTAHKLVMETGSTVDRSGTIASESFGTMSISYGSGVGGVQSEYETTEYGRRFLAYQLGNFPGIAIAGAPTSG